MSSFDPTLELKPTVVRRLEVITDFGGRRSWPPEVKGEIMLEALSPGAVISEVARRHGVSGAAAPRRGSRLRSAADQAASEMAFGA